MVYNILWRSVKNTGVLYNRPVWTLDLLTELISAPNHPGKPKCPNVGLVMLIGLPLNHNTKLYHILSNKCIPNKHPKCQTNLKDLAISNISQQSILVEMQLPISGLIYSDIGLGRCTSPEYLTFQRQPKIWSDFYENCAKTSLQLGQLEMLNIPGNAQMKMIEDHNTTKAIAM